MEAANTNSHEIACKLICALHQQEIITTDVYENFLRLYYNRVKDAE